MYLNSLLILLDIEMWRFGALEEVIKLENHPNLLLSIRLMKLGLFLVEFRQIVAKGPFRTRRLGVQLESKWGS